ncbi:MAG: Npt1/Npt2 family nucleotide transporter [Myxococcota bacterium]
MAQSEKTDTIKAGGFREFFWPIYGSEHKVFLPMSAMIALILFNYTIARKTKDALVISSSGAETLVFLKTWVVLPSAFMFFLIYTKLNNVLSKNNVFYAIIGGFIIFFALFAWVLYPNRELIHPTTSADWLNSVLPQGLSGLVAVYRYWSFSMFYTMSELWGSAVAALMFWQFANSITPVKNAKRFYAHFYIVANIFVTFSGPVAIYFSKMNPHLPQEERWGITLHYLCGTLFVCGLLVMFLYYYTNRFIVPTLDLSEVGTGKPKKKKPKLSVGESISFLMRSKYLGLLAILVASYGISINLFETQWKHQAKLQYPTANEFSAFYGMYTTLLGVFTIVVLFIGSAMTRKLGWKKAALATPITIGTIGFIFFLCIVFPEAVAPFAGFFGVSAVMVGVVLGTIGNILNKSIKYSLFDPTKEMAYIPLDDESKSKGKAAVDVVGGRFGKSGGALLQQVMLVTIGPIGIIAPYAGVCLMIIVAIWAFAVLKLHKEFSKLSQEANRTS